MQGRHFLQVSKYLWYISWTLLKPERAQNTERTQNVFQLRSVLKPERTFFILSTKKVRSGFSTERDFQNFGFSTTFWF